MACKYHLSPFGSPDHVKNEFSETKMKFQIKFIKKNNSPAGKYRTQQRSGQCLPAMVLRTNTQPTCRYPPGQSYPAIHTEEARIQILRHHPSGQWRRTAGIPKSRRIDKETTNLSFKGVISRQVGLGVKANTRAYVFTEVSALTSSTPDGAERSDNSSNSFK